MQAIALDIIALDIIRQTSTGQGVKASWPLAKGANDGIYRRRHFRG